MRPLFVFGLLGVVGLTACDGGGSGVVNTPGGRRPTAVPTQGMPPGLATNRAPSIGGAPAEAVRIGDPFAFQPTAADADGDPLTFGVFNSPLWMKFDPTSGALEGTPTAADVGRYRNIEISVSDGRESAVLLFDVEVVVLGTGSITLNWVPATEREDGSLLDEHGGHKIYWGTKPGDYPKVFVIGDPGITRYVIEGLVPGTYYIAMSTIDGDGVESELTAPVEIRVTS